MTARVQISFKIAPAGHGVITSLQDRVEQAGFKRPNLSDVARFVFHEVLNDKSLKDRIFAKLCEAGKL